jgi:hypothetical protein
MTGCSLEDAIAMNSVMTEMSWTKAPVLGGLPWGTMGYVEIHEVHVGILFMKH